MKELSRILFAIFVLLIISQFSFAHDPQQHKEEDQQESVADTATISQHSAITDASGHHDEHQEMHVTTVEAKFSDFPSLHPLLVHFPIVLLLLAFLTQFLSLFIWKKELSLITAILLLGGFLGAYLVSTYFHPHTGQLSDFAQHVLDLHDQYADYTIWASGAALLLKVASHFFLNRELWVEMLVVVAIAGAAWSVSHAGHYGATLVHLHGVGPQGNHLEIHEDGHEHEH